MKRLAGSGGWQVSQGLVLQKACIVGEFGVITPSEYIWVTF